MRKERGRDKFYKYKKIMMFISKMSGYIPLKIRLKLFDIFRNTSGQVGIGIRYIFLKSIAKKCGDNVLIHRGVYLFCPQNLTIGNNVSIHPMSYIDAAGGINIGNDVSIAHGSTILSTSHSFDNPLVPIKDQSILYKETCIHNNVWIGNKTTVLYGITINSGSVIGAHSLVTKNVESDVILGGVPAKIIKRR